MHHIARLTAVLLLAITSVVSGQPKEPNDVPHKVRYDRTQALPTGIAFDLTLLALVQFQENGDRESAVEWIQNELDMDEAESSAFLTQAIVTKQEIDAETQAAISSHACSAGEAYDLLDKMYDISESIADRYYDQTKDSLDRTTGVLLDNWMKERKTTIVHTRIDFEKADQNTGRDSTSVLTQLCRGGNQ